VSADRIVLSSRIRAELADLERVVERARRGFDKASASGDDEWLDAVALNLHAFYAGVEWIFEEIAREVDSAIPAGPEWRRSLLRQMAAELPGLRPPRDWAGHARLSGRVSQLQTCGQKCLYVQLAPGARSRPDDRASPLL